jgi:arylsulfatase A-like enzyme
LLIKGSELIGNSRTARIAIGVAAAAVFLATGCDSSQPSDRREPNGRDSPNVLIFVTDDQPASMMRVMRKTGDHLGRGGTTFSNAVVSTPLCCPSRASILSGRYAHNHGVSTNERSTVQNFDGRSSLATVLKENGYLTGISGKYMNAWSRIFDKPHGFDRWAVYDKGSNPLFTEALFNIDGRVQKVNEYATSFTERKAIEFLEEFHRQDGSAPWFLLVTPHAPHKPATPERRYKDAPVTPLRVGTTSGEDEDDKPEWVHRVNTPDRGSLSELHGRMQRTLLSVDDMVDEIMRQIQRQGDANNTLIFYTSDNGFMLGEHGLRGKRHPYHSSVRVPLLMRWDAGGVPAGITDSRIVANVDIAPTVFDAANIDPGRPVDGRSLLSDFERDEMLIEFSDSTSPVTPPYAMLWHPSWAFIRYPDSGELEYYSHNDPHQSTNVYGDGVDGNEPINEPELIRRLRTYEGCAVSSCP